MLQKSVALKLPARRHASKAELSRILIVSSVLASIFVTALAMGTGPLGSSVQKAMSARTTVASRQDDDLTTGSIIFVPVLGNDCRQNLIDNTTGAVREGGTVPCDKALAASRRAGGGPATRLDVIRQSFRGAPR